MIDFRGRGFVFLPHGRLLYHEFLTLTGRRLLIRLRRHYVARHLLLDVSRLAESLSKMYRRFSRPARGGQVFQRADGDYERPAEQVPLAEQIDSLPDEETPEEGLLDYATFITTGAPFAKA